MGSFPDTYNDTSVFTSRKGVHIDARNSETVAMLVYGNKVVRRLNSFLM